LDIKPQDVKDPVMSHQEIMTELEQNGERSSGFYDEDARKLQEIYDAGFHEYVKKVKEERKQNKQRAQKQLRLQKKRLLHERQLKEEAEQVEIDSQFQMWLEMIRQDITQPACLISVNSITARVLSQALWDNKSITTLNLSRNNLDDFSGLRLGRMLMRNTRLSKLELDTNNFGPRTCTAIGASLKTNTTLKHLTMENNPLSKRKDGSTDYGGLANLAGCFPHNKTLVSLNLWRCNIGKEGGMAFEKALEKNDTLVFLEVGNNGIPADCIQEIAHRLESNMMCEKDRQSVRRSEEEKQAEKDAEVFAAKEKVRKKEEFLKWMEDMKVERSETRRKEIEEARIRQEAEQARVEEEQRIAREKAAKEAEGGKKKKGKKKK
jgi:hypothetical protein